MEGMGKWGKASIVPNLLASPLLIVAIACFCKGCMVTGWITSGLGTVSMIAAYVLEAIARHKGEWVP